MNWEEYCEFNNVPIKFQKINPFELPPHLIELGKSWFDNPFSMILHGDVGRGKTYFSYCMIHELVRKGLYHEVIFEKSKKIDDLLVSEFEQHRSSASIINHFSRIPILFIDDFGLDRSTERMERDLYEIIDFRWSNEFITIISTNFNNHQIEKIYGTRILSRLKDFIWVEFTGPDLRGK